MGLKDDLELLAKHPEAMERFIASLQERATHFGIFEVLGNDLNEVREMIRYEPEFKEQRQLILGIKEPQYLAHALLCANAVGGERGRRIGRQAAQSMLDDIRTASRIDADMRYRMGTRVNS